MDTDNLSGLTLGRYELRQKLGSGGMGTVYRAHDPRLEREVAIKVLPPTLSDHPNFAARFTREAKVAASLQHPHIVPVFDYDIQDGISYVVMPLLTGGTLADRLAERFSIEAVHYLVEALAAALDYAHRRELVHRDIKPGNIIFDEHGTPMILDFGIVKLLHEEVTNLTGGRSPGTPRYMAPEQWRGEAITPATDQYALGVVVYEMLTGQAPFYGETVHALMYAHLEHHPTPPHRLNPALPPAVSDVVMRALAKKADDRYPGVLAFAAALREAVAVAPEDDLETTPLTHIEAPAAQVSADVDAAPPPRPRGRWWMGLVAIGFIAAAGLAILLALGDDGETTPAPGFTEAAIAPPETTSSATAALRTMPSARTLSPTEQEAAVVQNPTPRPPAATTPVPTPSTDALALPTDLPPITIENAAQVQQIAMLGRGTVQDMAVHPDGDRLAVATRLGVWLYSMPQIEMLGMMGEHPDWVQAVVYSPDGSLLASGGGDNVVRLWDMETGQLYAMLEGHTNSVWSVAYSPDGARLVSGDADGQVFLWDSVTARRINSWEAHSAGVSDLAFSPDGSLLASRSYSDRSVRLWALDSSPGAPLFEVSQYAYTITFAADGSTLVVSSSTDGLQLWDINTLQAIDPPPAADTYVVAFAPDGSLLATGDTAGGIQLWDVRTMDAVATLEGQSDTIEDLAWSPDGDWLVSSSADGTIWTWDVAGAQPLAHLDQHFRGPNDALFGPDGIVGAYPSGHLRQWDEAGTLDELALYTDSLFVVAYAPAADLLAVGDDEGAIRVWGGSPLRQIARLDGHTDFISALAMSADGTLLTSGSFDNTVRLWDPQLGTELGVLDGFEWGIDALAVSPDGQMLAVAAESAVISLWDVATQSQGLTLDAATGNVEDLAFSPDGALLVSAHSGTNIVRIWDVQTGAVLHTLEGHTASVATLAFSPHGAVLASSGYDETVRLWDVARGELLATLTGHVTDVQRVDFAPDGSGLLSMGSDTIIVWGVVE